MVTKTLSARVCAGCAKPLGVTAIYGAYWHLACWLKASSAEREEARTAQAATRRAP